MTTSKDKFQIRLDEKLLELKECQKEKCVNSCLKCENILNCSLREKYVAAVYSSMNKDDISGGFEF